MKKLYQVVTIRDYSPSCEEWVQYEGENLEEAQAVLDRENRYNDKYHYSEIRVYDSDKTFNEMDQDEYLDLLMSGYDIIK